jgi:epoxyqueuosine reductase QueG
LYDLNNELVDDCSMLIGQTGLYTTINTYNETNAVEVFQQYNRGFGLLTNQLSCLITGWNSYKKPRDQLLFKLRAQEKRSPLRSATPVIIITEDHRKDLRQIALDPMDGYVAAYLHADEYHDVIADTLHKIVFGNRAHEMNSIAYAKLQSESDD